MIDSIRRISNFDFNHAPFLTIWETTRSCGLACKHCRAEAILGRDPGELSTEEGKRLLEQIAAMGTPIVILSGGDPLNRPDLEILIAHGKSLGLRVATIPAATRNLTRERILSLKRAGIDQIAFSLDGPTPETHDSFRGISGAFEKTMEGVEFVLETGVPLQINTCFAAWNLQHLEAMISLVRNLGAAFWEVFFLIPIGRGEAMKGLTPSQFETVFGRFHRLSKEVGFTVKLTEAQHFKRFTLNDGKMGGVPAVNSAKGFAFVDHLGNICPSGFLPIPAGNLREDSLADVYRNAPLFRALRDPDQLKGKCGYCEFKSVCGGSRARAYASTRGDYLAPDPACAYIPRQ